MSISFVSFRGGETAGSPAYQSNVMFQGGETTGSPAFVNELPQKLASVPQEQMNDMVNFRASDYSYFDYPQKKKSKVLPMILGATGIIVASVVGLGYAHKTNVIDKVSNEKIKKILSKFEPVTKQCHQWLHSTKEVGVNIWEKLKSIGGKK